METVVRRVVVITLVVAVLFASSPQAADQVFSDPHVRMLEPCRGSLVEDAARLSPTVRELVETLERSDLVVYVRCALLKNSSITGRLSFLGAVADRRYVVVEIRLHDQYSSQISTLAHELQHAVEVAQAPSIRDNASMAAHYRQIGIAIDRHPLIFETLAAREIGDRVHRELFGASARMRAAEIIAGSR
jgi:hypothetical protein